MAKRGRILRADTKRQLPLRVVLLILAFVPSAAMIALLAINTSQLYGDWHSATSRENSVVSNAESVPTVEILYDLQAERRLSGAALGDPADYQAKLAQERKLTDASATSLESLGGTGSQAVTASLDQLTAQLRKLPGYRTALDQGTVTQQQVYDEYTDVISSDLSLFTVLSQTGVATLDVKSMPAMAQSWGQEMISREDAVITAGAASGRLTSTARAEIAQAAGAEEFIYQDQVLPFFPASVSDLYRNVLGSTAWQQKTQVEQEIAAASGATTSGDTIVSTALGQQWAQVVATLTPELQRVTQAETVYVISSGNSVVGSLKTRLITETGLGVAGVLLVVALTWYLISVLRRRIFALREAALELQSRLPDVVERLRRGETVDTDAELPELHYGNDELGMLGTALNAARGTALETVVHQVEQYRGFERLLQRIARRTQLLIGLQMKRLTEMERRHEDPDLLEGLFDLDHLAARLRRYEENLVILGGGQPQRRWRKPVPLLDVLRSAQGEVQDYRRIRIETDGRVWVSERAVGALVHVLAELMENAVAFSKPPAPVEVTASQVVHGLAIEIEDRGVGMDAEQYEQANALMAEPPRMDVLSRADDTRLGLYVVARLAANLDLKVELRPSSFGGTRVVVLVPAELVVQAGPEPEPERGEERLAPAPRLVAVGAPAPEPAAASSASVSSGGLDPLPRRVKLASLTDELREPRAARAEREQAPDPGRSGATVGAFQRQSRRARPAEDGGQPLSEEDGR